MGSRSANVKYRMKLSDVTFFSDSVRNTSAQRADGIMGPWYLNVEFVPQSGRITLTLFSLSWRPAPPRPTAVSAIFASERSDVTMFYFFLRFVFFPRTLFRLVVLKNTIRHHRLFAYHHYHIIIIIIIIIIYMHPTWKF